MEPSQALVSYEPLTQKSRAQLWTELPTDVRRRRAMEAANNHDGATLFDLLHGYMLLKSKSKANVSPHTIKSYHLAVNDLLHAWQRENLLHPSQDAGDRYISMLTERLGPASCHARLYGARALYRALRWARATQDDPFGDVRAPRNPTAKHERRQAYPDADLAALANAAEPVLRALILVCGHGGLRISEALRLLWQDVDLARSVLRVRTGKGGGSRSVALSDSLAAALANISGTPARGPVFRTAYGDGYADPTVPRQLLQTLCKETGIRYLGFHALRHSAATRLLRESGNLGLVAAHLGHADVSTTAVYAKVDQQQVHKALSSW